MLKGIFPIQLLLYTSVQCRNVLLGHNCAIEKLSDNNHTDCYNPISKLSAFAANMVYYVDEKTSSFSEFPETWNGRKLPGKYIMQRLEHFLHLEYVG